PRLGQRLERLHATDVGAGEEMREGLVREERDECLGLTPPRLRQRPEVIGVAPLLALTGFRMPDEVDRRRHSRGAARSRSFLSRPYVSMRAASSRETQRTSSI